MTDLVTNWMNEKQCPICKKLFIVNNEEWAYKCRVANTNIYYCSWHCYREMQMRSGRKKPTTIDRKTACGKGDAIKDRLMKGVKPKDIRDELGVCFATINYWHNKLELEGLL